MADWGKAVFSNTPRRQMGGARPQASISVAIEKSWSDHHHIAIDNNQEIMTNAPPDSGPEAKWAASPTTFWFDHHTPCAWWTSMHLIGKPEFAFATFPSNEHVMLATVLRSHHARLLVIRVTETSDYRFGRIFIIEPVATSSWIHHSKSMQIQTCPLGTVLCFLHRPTCAFG